MQDVVLPHRIEPGIPEQILSLSGQLISSLPSGQSISRNIRKPKRLILVFARDIVSASFSYLHHIDTIYLYIVRWRI